MTLEEEVYSILIENISKEKTEMGFLFEETVAASIRKVNESIQANVSNEGVGYSDILVQTTDGDAWIEVKTNHKDNMGNIRFSFYNGVWNTRNNSPLAIYSLEKLNREDQPKRFIDAIAKFKNIDVSGLIVSSNISDLKYDSAVSIEDMQYFLDHIWKGRYIYSESRDDLANLVVSYYNIGKSAPVYYMQSANDFYLLGSENPLGLPDDIPILSGSGTFKIRISIRSKKYEIQNELKLNSMISSDYSLLKNSGKKNPLEKYT